MRYEVQGSSTPLNRWEVWSVRQGIEDAKVSYESWKAIYEKTPIKIRLVEIHELVKVIEE